MQYVHLSLLNQDEKEQRAVSDQITRALYGAFSTQTKDKDCADP